MTPEQESKYAALRRAGYEYESTGPDGEVFIQLVERHPEFERVMDHMVILPCGFSHVIATADEQHSQLPSNL